MLAAMDFSAGSEVTIVRCEPIADKSVLALAAQAWPEEERAAQWQAIGAAVRAGNSADIVLLAARRGQELLAAAVAQALPGRSAVVWLPQFAAPPRDEQQSLASLLMTRLLGDLAAHGVQLAQALVSCDDQRAATQLQCSGFEFSADLLYLAAPADSFPEQPPRLPFVLEAFQMADGIRLVRLIERTYVGTLDCPRLDNLRETADVVAGYLAVGQFRPELWQIARYGGQDVGCLLVNLHPEVNHAEIVYLGLVPEVRGRGWGLELARQAQWQAELAECDQAVLAVDAANHPAIRMYAAAGFVQWDRRATWIKSLR